MNNVVTKLLKLIIRKLSAILTVAGLIGILCLCFCTWMCIHYLIQHYPNANITSQPFDYNGMVISFFALLVTLLVGWNIYSTIKAKDEIISDKKRLRQEANAFKAQIRNIAEQRLGNMEKRMSDFDKCCKERGIEIEAIKTEMDKKIKSAEVKVAMANALLQYNNAEKAKENFEKKLYEEAYRHFVDALCLYFEIGENRGEIKRCTDYLERCLNGLKDSHQLFGEVVYNECIKNLNAILASSKFTITDLQRKRIEAIKAHQEDISFTTIYQSLYNYAFSILERPPSDDTSSEAKDGKTSDK